MIGTHIDINKLQDEKLKLQIKLNDLLNSKNYTKDEINELRSDIKHLDKEINKILGSNEVERINELKRKKSGIDEKKKKNYYALKNRYDKIRKIEISVKRIMSAVDNYSNEIKNSEFVKVR